jgi:hypothetical protein
MPNKENKKNSKKEGPNLPSKPFRENFYPSS